MIPSSVSPDQTLIDRLHRWGLADVAPLALAALRPLGGVGGQLLTLASPILTTFIAPQRLDDWIELLDDEERLDQLTRALENEVDQ